MNYLVNILELYYMCFFKILYLFPLQEESQGPYGDTNISTGQFG